MGRHNFDADAQCEGCNNISEIPETFNLARTEARARIKDVS